MWLQLTENMGNAVAFYLAMHNSNAPMAMADFTAAFRNPNQKSFGETVIDLFRRNDA